MSTLPVVTKIHFVVSARDLPHKVRAGTGLSSIPDPYVRVWHKDHAHAEYQELCKTDHLVNTANPDWLHVHGFDWRRGVGQVWRFDVVDFDPLNKDDLIGSLEVDVDRYVLEHNKEFEGKLFNGGTLFVKGTSVLQFKIQVENLPKLDTHSGSDPYVQCFWSFGPLGERHMFYRTKTVDDALNVAYKEPATFRNYQQGANQFFTFRVLDEDTVSDEVIGEVSVAIDDYVQKGDGVVVRLNEPKNQAIIKITPV